jgi:hypothetical protein
MTIYTASIETTNKGTFVYGFHLGTIEWIARDAARELMHLRYARRLGEIRVRTIGLLADGRLIDVFDGEWTSEIDNDFWTADDEIETRVW